MREAEDSVSTQETLSLKMSDPVGEASPHRSTQSIVAGDDSRSLQFWIRAGLPVIRLGELEHRSAKTCRALLSSPNHPRLSQYNFGISERDKSWFVGP
jgi:hypothetical protein